MITYNIRYFGLGLLCQVRGSVFPRVLPVTLPSTLLAVGLSLLWNYQSADGAEFILSRSVSASNFNLVYAGYTSILAFMIVFRSNLAYSRYWEGAQCISNARAVWLNAVSNLVAFCDRDRDKKQKVQEFQEVLVKFMSMLFCESLREAMQESDDTFLTLSLEGIEDASLQFLDNCPIKSPVILQWIQQLIVEADSSKVIKVAPPILSRVFQELSNGVVSMKQAQNIADVQFPYPYTQLITWLLFFHTIITPILASLVISVAGWCGLLTFVVLQSLWCLQMTATELDQPFGQDPNDLPVEQHMTNFNLYLLMLLEPLAQRRPSYIPQNSVKQEGTARRRSVRLDAGKDLAPMDPSTLTHKNIAPVSRSAGGLESVPENIASDRNHITSSLIMEGNSFQAPPGCGRSVQDTGHRGVSSSTGHEAITLAQDMGRPSTSGDSDREVIYLTRGGVVKIRSDGSSVLTEATAAAEEHSVQKFRV
eukprot:TRINITY_DN27358_c0_g2_i1.p1 TRINITY_DN27358_c0_g2~~TRINITY_DN27358_c0_g2_i1.p1  ORF type:complete len:478 (-),score=66.08 TRINITY_DN27358_c0_g2_i1:120-1553(-)